MSINQPNNHGSVHNPNNAMKPELFAEELLAILRFCLNYRSLTDQMYGMLNEYAGALMLYDPEAFSDWHFAGDFGCDSNCVEAGEEFVLACVSIDEVTADALNETVTRLLDLLRQDEDYQVAVLGNAITVPEEAREDNLHLALRTIPLTDVPGFDLVALVKHLEDFFAGKIAVSTCLTDEEKDCCCESCKNTYYTPGNPPELEPPDYDIEVAEDLFAMISYRIHFAATARSCRRRLIRIHEAMGDEGYPLCGYLEEQSDKAARVLELFEQGYVAVGDTQPILSAVADDALDELHELIKVLLRSDEAQDTILEGAYAVPDTMLDQVATRISQFITADDPPDLEKIMPEFLNHAKLELAAFSG